MKKYPELHIVEWLTKKLEDMTYRELAKEIGCSPGAVANAVKRHGITVPKRNTRKISPDARQRKSERIKSTLRARYPDGRFGELASNWKGGRHVTMSGYVDVYSPDHPNARGGRVFEHRLVMEKVLGRLLETDEIVHHLDGNRQNNQPDNLVLKKRGKHVSEHFKAGHEVRELRKEIHELQKRIKELENENQRLREIKGEPK